MGSIIEEFLIVLAHSRRTQASLFFGLAFFILFQLVGAFMVNGVHLNGPFAPLTDTIREALLGRYEQAAWGALGSFFILAIRCYLKDRKRLLR